MISTRIHATCLAAFFVVIPLSMPAAEQKISITILTSFDYPGTYTATIPGEISDRGDIA